MFFICRKDATQFAVTHGRLLLFVTLDSGASLDDELRRLIAGSLREALSPRHVPDDVTAVPVIPRNLTGKKLELPVMRILQDARLEDVASRDALAVPTSLDAFTALAAEVSKENDEQVRT